MNHHQGTYMNCTLYICLAADSLNEVLYSMWDATTTASLTSLSCHTCPQIILNNF